MMYDMNSELFIVYCSLKIDCRISFFLPLLICNDDIETVLFNGINNVTNHHH